jgi:hypothetical protein
MLALRWFALALGILSVVSWVASYSWMVGLTPPTRWLSPDASPWLIAELSAVGTGAISLVAGLILAKRSGSDARRVPILAAALGGFAMGMSLLSIALPA